VRAALERRIGRSAAHDAHAAAEHSLGVLQGRP
jgi:hypothetical protein